MNKTIIAIALGLASLSVHAGQWEDCADNVEAWMYARGMCSATSCYDSDTKKTLQQMHIEQCGRPTYTKKERDELVEHAKTHCTLGVSKTGTEMFCPGYITRELNYYSPSDPIHKEILDGLKYD